MNIIRFLQKDKLSLEVYRKKEHISCQQFFDNIRATALKSRKDIRPHIVDSYIDIMKGYLPCNMSTVLVNSLVELAKRYLEIVDDRVYVKLHYMNEWQLLISDISPLLLTSALLWDTYKDIIKSSNRDYERLKNIISININWSALPSIENKELGEISNLRDVHVHINAILESDSLWQFILEHRYDLMQELSKTGARAELYDDIDLAGIISRIIGKHLLLGNRLNPLKDGLPLGYDKSVWTHPFKGNKNIGLLTPLQYECFLYLLAFDRMFRDEKSDFVYYFHYYLLLMGKVRETLLCNSEEVGHGRFKEKMHSPLHNIQKSKKDYLKLAINSLLVHKEINQIHLRFDAIYNYNQLKSISKFFFNEYNVKIILEPFLRKGGEVKKWQHDIEQAIGKILNESAYIEAVDVAGPDFDKEPSMFVKAFSELRNGGIKHFTYHIGEDFYHILTGIRNIYEAVEFLCLENGDRISHAVALGVEPEFWYTSIGPEIAMPLTKYLDDLIFIAFLVKKNFITLSKDEKIKLNEKISRYCNIIYENSYDTDTLIEAWLLRKETVLHGKDGLPYEILATWREGKNKMIMESFDIYDILSPKKIRNIQNWLLDYIQRKGIIIEVLPTSNIMVGQYTSFSNYHILRWLENNKSLKMRIGSDVPGVFSTNLYNEYCNLYSLLIKKYSKSKAISLLKKMH